MHRRRRSILRVGGTVRPVFPHAPPRRPYTDTQSPPDQGAHGFASPTTVSIVPTPATARHLAPVCCSTADHVRQSLELLQRRHLEPTRPAGSKRRAAVLVPIVHVNGRRCLLFTKRSSNVSTHRGQVSFPGGMQDEEDGLDPVTTALRETEEEVGVPFHDVDVLGMHHDVRSVTHVPVTPVLGCLRPHFESEAELLHDYLRVNPSEVDSAFIVPVHDLLEPSNIHSEGTSRSLCFLGGPHVIWGLTAFVTYRLLPWITMDHIGKAHFYPDQLDLLHLVKKNLKPQ